MLSKREMHKSISPLKKKKKALPKPVTPSPRRKFPEASPNSPKISDYFAPRNKDLPLSRRLSVKKISDDVKTQPSTSKAQDLLSELSFDDDWPSTISLPKKSTSYPPTNDILSPELSDNKKTPSSSIKIPKSSKRKPIQAKSDESFGRPTVYKTKRSLDFDFSEASPSKKMRISLDQTVDILIKNFVKFHHIYETNKIGDYNKIKKSFLEIYRSEITDSTSNSQELDNSLILVEKEIETITVDSEEIVDNLSSINPQECKIKTVLPQETAIKIDNENAQFENGTNEVTIERVSPKNDVQKKRTTLKRSSPRTSNAEDIENVPLEDSPPPPRIADKKPSVPRLQNGNSLISPSKIVKTEFKVPRPKSFELSDALIFAITKSEKYLSFFFNNINRKFASDYENLSPVGRQLYLNLLGRKWYWLRKDSIKVDNIKDVETSLEPLFNIGFIKTMDLSCPLEESLQNMNAEELSSLCVHLNLTKTGTKDVKIKSILQLANRKGFKFSSACPREKIMAKVVEMIGQKTIKLSEEPRSFFLKLIVASTCPYYQDEESERFSHLRIALGKLNRKEAFLLPLTVVPRKLFQDVAHFESYFKSVQMKGELQDAKLKKNWPKVVEICEGAYNDLKSFLANTVVLFMTDDYFRKFTAGSVLSYCLSSSLDIIKREKRYDFALECIELLLSQHHFVQRRRATWYEQKALILERYKKSGALEIFEVLKKGLEDPQLSLLGRRILSKKAEPYTNPKSKKLKADKKQELQQLLSIPMNVGIEEIYCKPKPSVSTSKKQIFEKELGDDILYGSVEEIASHYYRHRFPNRIHDEGRMFKNLALALFHPVIYKGNPEMFVSEMQDRPLDWGGVHFFQARKTEFEQKKKELISSPIEKIESYLCQLCKDLKNSLQLLLKIDERDVLFMMGLLKAMTVEKFTDAALYLFENFNERKSGLPDLTMYNETECAFIEVKGPTDTPSVNQVLWLEKLYEFGFNRVICKVTSKVTGVSEQPALGEETQSN